MPTSLRALLFLFALVLFAAPVAHTQPAAAPATAPEAAPAADAPPAAEEPASNPETATEPEASPAIPKDDPYLTNWKKFEHRDEVAAGRGPMGRKIGLGVGLGRPLTLGGKVYLGQTWGVQADIGGTYSWEGPELSVQAHIVWHPYTFVANENFKFSGYVGAGGRAGFWPLVITGSPAWVPRCVDPCRRPAFVYFGEGSVPGTFGMQGVGGLDVQLQKFPLEFYVQGMPTVELFPGVSADLGLQLGVRWYAF